MVIAMSTLDYVTEVSDYWVKSLTIKKIFNYLQGLGN